MLMVRLQRVGRKHEPVFRLVLTDSKNSPKSGKFLEILGHYDARRGEKSEFKTDRVKHWIAQGAQLSTTVHNLLIEKKTIEGKKINNLPKKRAIVTEKPAEAEVKPQAPEVAPAEVVETPTVEIPTVETPTEEPKKEVADEATS